MIAPAGKDLWIAVSTLNQLRRQDPTKVEPLWNDQYAVLLSWFGENSPYSLLQHTGTMGYVLSALLGNSGVLRSLMVLSMAGAALLLLPLLEYIANRALVSSYLWLKWARSEYEISLSFSNVSYWTTRFHSLWGLVPRGSLKDMTQVTELMMMMTTTKCWMTIATTTTTSRTRQTNQKERLLSPPIMSYI